MPKKLTIEEFIEKANKVHNSKYNYQQVEYKNALTKIKIICPIHGEFYQEPILEFNNKQLTYMENEIFEQFVLSKIKENSFD